MISKKTSKCPKCGFVYTVLNLPNPPRTGLAQDHRRFPWLGLPWPCVCGTWLQARTWWFDWGDMLGIVAIAVIAFAIALRYPWALGFLGVAMAVWIGFRTMGRVAVDEVAAPPLDAPPVVIGPPPRGGARRAGIE